MVKFILAMVVRMFASFAGITLVEDTEVYLVDEAYIASFDEMTYQETINYEIVLDEEEDTVFDFMGVIYEDGSEYYAFLYDSNDFYLQVISDHTGKVVCYSIEHYDE